VVLARYGVGLRLVWLWCDNDLPIFISDVYCWRFNFGLCQIADQVQ
jgi:hypothetical protein